MAKTLTFKVNNGVNLINVSIHPSLGDHLRSNLLRLKCVIGYS